MYNLQPACEHIGFIRVNEAGPPASLALDRKVLVCQPPTDGAGTEAKLLSDLYAWQALVLKLHHLLIPLEAPFTVRTLHLLDQRRSLGRSRSHRERSQRSFWGSILLVLLAWLLSLWRNQNLGNAPKLGTILFKHKRRCLSEIVDNVPAVSYLNGLWSAGRGGTRIISTSIAADHLDIRMRASTRRWQSQRHGLLTGQRPGGCPDLQAWCRT